jgi:hypothetical protein
VLAWFGGKDNYIERHTEWVSDAGESQAGWAAPVSLLVVSGANDR